MSETQMPVASGGVARGARESVNPGFLWAAFNRRLPRRTWRKQPPSDIRQMGNQQPQGATHQAGG